MRAKTLVFCSLIVCFGNISRAPAAENATFHAAILSITAEDLKSHVDVLADDSFEGREAGSRGGHAAAGYLRQHMQKQGLTGVGNDNSFFQSFGNGYRNVIGYFPGRDPNLRNEFIVIGAHYDHVGYGNRGNSFGPFGYVHNGADDNASGVAGLLEVLDAIVMLPEAPRRSVVFAFWDGEEKGLLGSKHWVNFPTIPLEKIALAFNVDMIGRLKHRKLEVYGTRSATGLRRLLSEMNRDTNLRIDYSWEMKSNSDHYSFFDARIPVLMFHTGLHDDYHRPSDDAHLVNTDGMQEVTRFMLNAVYGLANRQQSTPFRQASELESPGSKQQLEAATGPAPPRLGVRWSPPEETDRGLELDDVEVDSAAYRAGLVVGDRILRFDGEEVKDPTVFRGLLLSAASPVSVVISREGEDEPIDLSVELDGRPTRVGISWRRDDAEPDSVIVTRVVRGSPARNAELRTRDRIYEIDGRPVGDSDELFELLTTLPSPIELLIERDGQLKTVELEVPPNSRS
jgi:hypothetical protein